MDNINFPSSVGLFHSSFCKCFTSVDKLSLEVALPGEGKFNSSLLGVFCFVRAWDLAQPAACAGV